MIFYLYIYILFDVCNISLPLKCALSQNNGSEKCSCRKCYDSKDVSSSGRFFHSIRCYLITWENNLFSLVEVISYGSKVIFPSSSKIGIIVCAFWCCPSYFFRYDTWKMLWMWLVSDNSNPYATWLIFLLIWYGPWHLGSSLFFPPCLSDNCL